MGREKSPSGESLAQQSPQCSEDPVHFQTGLSVRYQWFSLSTHWQVRQKLLYNAHRAGHFLLTPTSFIDVWNDFVCLQHPNALLHHSAVFRLVPLPPLHIKIKHKVEIELQYISSIQKWQFKQGLQNKYSVEGQGWGQFSRFDLNFGPTVYHHSSIVWFSQCMTTLGEINYGKHMHIYRLYIVSNALYLHIIGSGTGCVCLLK